MKMTRTCSNRAHKPGSHVVSALEIFLSLVY
jgi:hypothetical protein